eukprot:360722-Chlamydomonas_euryale.AAC.5
MHRGLAHAGQCGIHSTQNKHSVPTFAAPLLYDTRYVRPSPRDIPGMATAALPESDKPPSPRAVDAACARTHTRTGAYTQTITGGMSGTQLG